MHSSETEPPTRDEPVEAQPAAPPAEDGQELEKPAEAGSDDRLDDQAREQIKQAERDAGD